MAQLSSLSLPSPISQTKDSPTPSPPGAFAGHTALINRRGLFFLQRFVVQNPQYNTNLHKNIAGACTIHH